MSRPPRLPERPRGRLLNEEDRALWEHVVRDIAPLGPRRRRVAGGAVTAATSPRSTDQPATSVAAGRPDTPPPQRNAQQPPTMSVGPAPKADPVSPAKASVLFDRKRARKLAAGRIAIDARIDLHGMRQADAHDALVAFLTRSVARGFRTVLVITGKGGAGADRSPDHTGATRGVLRRNVPRWLAEPALARVIVSFTEAHIRHGGAGALYIHLKSSGRT